MFMNSFKIEIDLDNPVNCSICINDQKIGCIQDITCKLSTSNLQPEIDITFPNLREIGSKLEKSINDYICKITEINKLCKTNIKVKLLPINFISGEYKKETIITNKNSTTPV